MPPIKRNQKPVAAPVARRLAGHAGPTRQAGPTPRVDRAGTAASEARQEKTVQEEAAQEEAAQEGTLQGEAGQDEAGQAGPAGAGGSWEAVTAGATAARGSTSEAEGSAGSSERGGAARTLTYAALVVGVAAGAAGIYLAFQPGISIPNEAFVDRAETDAVLTAASSNVQRLVSIDHETLDEYHDSLGEFLTPNLVDDLNENWPALRDSYEQSATTVDAQVKEAGLAYLEGDRAEVLLVQDVSMERDGVAVGSTSGTYLVGLDRVDGVWKLSRIPDLPS